MTLPSLNKRFSVTDILGRATLLLVWPCAQWASGHGIPIRVDVVDDELVATDGFVDPVGLASMVFADPTPDSAFRGAPNSIQLTDFPGFDINGMQPDSSLFLQPFGTSVWQGDRRATRVLWHWSAETGNVETAPNDQTLRLLSTRGFGEVTLPQWGGPPPELRVAEPRASDLGEHRHLVYYILDDSPPAAHGVYAFFATLNSPEYNVSEPLLVALNHGLDGDTFVQGALAINQAAVLPGDYDRNGVVDTRDYDTWQGVFGDEAAPPGVAGDGNRDGWVTAADYVIWRNAYAASHARDSSSTVVVPEPASLALVLPAVVSLAVGLRRRYGCRNCWGYAALADFGGCHRGNLWLTCVVFFGNRIDCDDQGCANSPQDIGQGRVLSACSRSGDRGQV